VSSSNERLTSPNSIDPFTKICRRTPRVDTALLLRLRISGIYEHFPSCVYENDCYELVCTPARSSSEKSTSSLLDFLPAASDHHTSHGSVSFEQEKRRKFSLPYSICATAQEAVDKNRRILCECQQGIVSQKCLDEHFYCTQSKCLMQIQSPFFSSRFLCIFGEEIETKKMDFEFARRLHHSQQMSREYSNYCSLLYAPNARCTRATQQKMSLHLDSLDYILKHSCSVVETITTIVNEKKFSFDAEKLLINKSSTWLFDDLFMCAEKLKKISQHAYYDDVQERRQKFCTLVEHLRREHVENVLKPAVESARSSKKETIALYEHERRLPALSSYGYRTYLDHAQFQRTYYDLDLPENNDEKTYVPLSAEQGGFLFDKENASKVRGEWSNVADEEFSTLYAWFMEHGAEKLGMKNLILNPYHEQNLTQIKFEHATTSDKKGLEQHYLYYCLLLRIRYAKEFLDDARIHRIPGCQERIQHFLDVNLHFLQAIYAHCGFSVNDKTIMSTYCIFGKAAPKIFVPLFQKYYPFLDYEFRTSDYELLPTYVRYVCKDAPEKILAAEFGASSNFRGLSSLCTLFLLRNGLPNHLEQLFSASKSTTSFAETDDAIEALQKLDEQDERVSRRGDVLKQLEWLDAGTRKMIEKKKSTVYFLFDKYCHWVDGEKKADKVKTRYEKRAEKAAEKIKIVPGVSQDSIDAALQRILGNAPNEVLLKQYRECYREYYKRATSEMDALFESGKKDEQKKMLPLSVLKFDANDHVVHEIRAFQRCASKTTRDQLELLAGMDILLNHKLAQVVFAPFVDCVQWVQKKTLEHAQWIELWSALDALCCSKQRAVQRTENLSTAAQCATDGNIFDCIFGRYADSISEQLKEHEAASLSILLALTLRVYTAQLLAQMHEPCDLKTNLELFCDTHLDLSLYILEKRVFTDEKLMCVLSDSLSHVELLKAQLPESEPFDRTVISPVDLYYPYATRFVHEGDLPNYAHCFNFLNFFSKSKIFGDQTWCYMVFKRFPKACQVRASEDVNYRQAVCNDSYYKWLCWCIEVSLKGAYKHAAFRPSFFRRLQIHSFSRNWFSDFSATKKHFLNFMHKNRAIVDLCIKEYSVVSLQNNPCLYEILLQPYSMDYFSLETRLSMDLIRQQFDQKGIFDSPVTAMDVIQRKFALATREVFKFADDSSSRIQKTIVEMEDAQRKKKKRKVEPIESSMLKKMVRNQENCLKTRVYRRSAFPLLEIKKAFEDYDILRALRENASFLLLPNTKITLCKWLESKSKAYKINELKYGLLYRYVQSLPPESNFEKIDFTVLKQFGVSDANYMLFSQFLEQKKFLLLEQLYSADVQQFVVCALFVDFLYKHTRMRLTRIQNFTLVSNQMQALCRLYNNCSADKLPKMAGTVVISPCCAKIKSVVSDGQQARGMGHQFVLYNDVEERYLCARKVDAQKLSQKSKKFANQATISKKFLAFVSEKEKKSKLLEFLSVAYNNFSFTCTKLTEIYAGFLQRLSEKDNRSKKLLIPRFLSANEKSCVDTDVIMLPLVGYILECPDFSLTSTKGSGGGGASCNLPYWINPCCGRLDYFVAAFYGANGYKCRTCSLEQDFRHRDVEICDLCHRVPPHAKPLSSRILYDDECTFRFKTFRICHRCNTQQSGGTGVNVLHSLPATAAATRMTGRKRGLSSAKMAANARSMAADHAGDNIRTVSFVRSFLR